MRPSETSALRSSFASAPTCVVVAPVVTAACVVDDG